MKDALGNEIVLGKNYVVSERIKGGAVIVNIGTAIKFTPGGKATLQITRQVYHETDGQTKMHECEKCIGSWLPGLFVPLA